uniref:Uncharacterized protein n=1 Tax=Neisseria meningitidis alpha522 TaxID=996307 RepID=I4E8A0_NEIME|nr:hypothetical protein NMALPHA522_2028 [Neisseria meningitidis alpha522]
MYDFALAHYRILISVQDSDGIRQPPHLLQFLTIPW